MDRECRKVAQFHSLVLWKTYPDIQLEHSKDGLANFAFRWIELS